MPPPRLPVRILRRPTLLRLPQTSLRISAAPIRVGSLNHTKTRTFTTTKSLLQDPFQQQPQPYNFYRTHGRAFFKTFTLAFLTYQVLYWIWLTIEAEEEKDAKDAEIRGLEGELRLLEGGRGSHELGKGRRVKEEEEEGGGLEDGKAE